MVGLDLRAAAEQPALGLGHQDDDLVAALLDPGVVDQVLASAPRPLSSTVVVSVSLGADVDLALAELDAQVDGLRCLERVHGCLRGHRTHPWMRLLDERLRPGRPGPKAVDEMSMLMLVAARAALTSQVLSDWPRAAGELLGASLERLGQPQGDAGDHVVVLVVARLRGLAVGGGGGRRRRSRRRRPTTTKTGSRPLSRTSTDVPWSSLVISDAACDRASIRVSRTAGSSAMASRSAACADLLATGFGGVARGLCGGSRRTGDVHGHHYDTTMVSGQHYC